MDAVVRYRAWIVMGVLLVVVVLAAILGAHTKSGSRAGGAVDRPHVGFGAGVEKLGATSQLVYTNGWVATSGTQTVAVYAGSQTLNRDNGLFVILRQARGATAQRLANVLVRGSGPVTLLRPPPPLTEQAAFQEVLHFITANGATGTLDLSTDRVTISR